MTFRSQAINTIVCLLYGLQTNLEGLSSHRTLPISLVAEDSSKVTDNVDNAKDEAAGAEEGEVGAALVAHVLVRSLPAGDEVKYRLGVSKRILRVVKRVVENLPLIH